jgi:hypothetical protein
VSAAAKIPMSPVTEKFAKFAKFANFNPALEYRSLLDRHAPRLGSISAGAVSSPKSPSPVSDEPGTYEVGGG